MGSPHASRACTRACVGACVCAFLLAVYAMRLKRIITFSVLYIHTAAVTTCDDLCSFIRFWHDCIIYIIQTHLSCGQAQQKLLPL